jgi:RNA polymerase sigma-70 factor (ECF subfamily)
MRTHFDALYRAARRFSRNPGDAEDLVQDVCVKAFERCDEFANMEFQRAWLLRVLYHTFVDTTRRDGRTPTSIGGSLGDDTSSELATDSQQHPDEQADRQMGVERVLAALALLDKDDCTLLAMHDIEGMSIKELTGLTGMPAGTIKSRLFRTRAKLGRLVKNKQLGSVQLRLVQGKSGE